MLTNFDKSWRCTSNTHSSLTLSSLTTPIFPPLNFLLQFFNPSINIIFNLLLRCIMIIIIILLQILYKSIIPINFTIFITFKAKLLNLFLLSILMYFYDIYITWWFKCWDLWVWCDRIVLWGVYLLLGVYDLWDGDGLLCCYWFDEIFMGLGLFLDLFGFVLA